MNTLEAIKMRKSVRSYLAKPLEEDKVKAVAEAGDMAAKAGQVTLNVITNPEILRMISETGVQVMKNSGNPFLEKVASVPDYSPIYDSPAMIVVSAETTEDTMAVGMNTANCACAAQNMLLAATELGLGSCYIVSGTLAFMVPEVKATAGIAENMTPSCAVIIGYTEDSAPHADAMKIPITLSIADKYMRDYIKIPETIFLF